MKKPTINNPPPPFPFFILTLRLSDTYPAKDFMTKFTYFCFKYINLNDLYAILNLK